MGRVHEIAVGGDTSGFEKSVQHGLIEPLEDAEKALKELGDSDAGRDLERGLERGQKQTEDLREELDDTRRGLDKLGFAGKDAGRDIDRGMGKASQGMEDFKQESNSTLRETAASISSLEDGVGSLQEIAANAFAGFGPVGAGAGLVAALGLGLVTAELQAQQEANERLRDSYSEMYQTAAEEGRKYLDVAQINAAAQDLINNPDRLSEYNKLKADALQLGIDDNQLILARAGDQEALNAVLQATVGKQQEIRDESRENAATTRLSQADEASALRRIQGDYEKIGQLHKTNAENAVKGQEIKNTLHTQEREQIQRNKDAETSRYEAMAEHYGKPITPTVDSSTAETQWAQMLQRMRNQAATLQVQGFGLTGMRRE